MTTFLLSFIGGCVACLVVQKLIKMWVSYNEPVEIHATKLSSISYKVNDKNLEDKCRKITKNLYRKMLAAARRGDNSVLVDTGISSYDYKFVEPYIKSVKKYLEGKGVFSLEIERHLAGISCFYTNHIRIKW